MVIRSFKWKIILVILIQVCLVSVYTQGFILSENRTIRTAKQISRQNLSEGISEISSSTRGNVWNIEQVDIQGDVGQYTSIALDSNDRPHISYHDNTDNELKYAKWNGTAWEIEMIDTTGDTGKYTSIAVDSNDRPHISYYDDASNELKYAKWNGAAWEKEVVDDNNDAGRYSSLALDSNDRPHISYHDNSANELKYAKWNGAAWEIEMVDTNGDAGRYTSIALNSSDYPHISYHDNSNNDLEYAYWDGAQWQLQTVDSTGGRDMGQYTSIDLDTNDRPHISYHDNTNNELKYAKWNGTAWEYEIIDSNGDTGRYTSIQTGDENNTAISYYDNSNDDLKYAIWNGSTWDISTIDSTGDVGRYVSLRLDGNNSIHVSYYDGTNQDLKYAILDQKAPNLDEDRSPDFGTTGDPYRFNISASDNFDVASSYVNWNHSLSGGNISLTERSDYWDGMIQLQDEIEDLTYTVYINDSSGNQFNSSLRLVNVHDNDYPVMDSDSTPGFGTTGDELEFNISASDNIQVSSIHVNWSHGLQDGNLSLDDNGNNWVGKITLNDGLENCTYTAYVKDTGDNYFISTVRTINVQDNDKPVFGKIWNNTLSIGELGVFYANITENVGIDMVMFDFTINGIKNHNWSVTNRTDEIWTINVSLSMDIADIEYNFWAMDTSQNHIRTSNFSYQVTDTSEPRFGNVWNSTLIAGSPAIFSINVTDNIGVQSVMFSYTLQTTTRGVASFVNWSVNNRTGDSWEISFLLPAKTASIEYYFWCTDVAGNSGRSAIYISSVGDVENPIANCGPDAQSTNLSAIFMFDGTSCSDNIGIVNYTWFFNYEGKEIKLYGINPGFRFDIIETYLVTLRVTDAAGNWDDDYFILSVLDNANPLAIAGEDITINQSENATFNATLSSDNVGILNYVWTFQVNGTEYILYGPLVKFKFAAAGNYTINLTVIDERGNIGTDSFLVTVQIPVMDDDDDDDEMPNDDTSDDDTPDDDAPDDDTTDDDTDDDTSDDDDDVGEDDKDAQSQFSRAVCITAIIVLAIIFLVFIFLRRGKRDKEEPLPWEDVEESSSDCPECGETMAEGQTECQFCGVKSKTEADKTARALKDLEEAVPVIPPKRVAKKSRPKRSATPKTQLAVFEGKKDLDKQLEKIDKIAPVLDDDLIDILGSIKDMIKSGKDFDTDLFGEDEKEKKSKIITKKRVKKPRYGMKVENDPLYDFTSKKESDGSVGRYGSKRKAEEKIDLFISRKAFKKMMKHCKEYRDEQLEVMGFMVGYLYKWENGDYTVVEDVVTSDLDTTEISVNFANFEALFEKLDKFEKLGKDYILVGWYHSHPGHTSFMSPTDVETQKRMFNKPYHSAVVIDPINIEMKAFALKGDEVKEKPYAIRQDRDEVFDIFKDGEEEMRALPWPKSVTKREPKIKEEEIRRALEEIKPGDVIISKSGTKRSVINVEDDDMLVKVTSKDGSKKKSIIQKSVLMLRLNAIEKIMPTKKEDFKLNSNLEGANAYEEFSTNSKEEVHELDIGNEDEDGIDYYSF